MLSLFYKVCQAASAGIQQSMGWGEEGLLNTACRLAQFNIELDEDEAGEPFARVHCRIKSLGLQTPWCLLWHLKMGQHYGLDCAPSAWANHKHHNICIARILARSDTVDFKIVGLHLGPRPWPMFPLRPPRQSGHGSARAHARATGRASEGCGQGAACTASTPSTLLPPASPWCSPAWPRSLQGRPPASAPQTKTKTQANKTTQAQGGGLWRWPGKVRPKARGVESSSLSDTATDPSPDVSSSPAAPAPSESDVALYLLRITEWGFPSSRTHIVQSGYVLGHGRFQWFLKRVGECDKTISSFGDQQTNTEFRSI